MSYRFSRSVFKDQGKLSFDYLPDKLLHRERQMQRLHSLFRPVLEAGSFSTAFLYGPVGTGKTHLSKRFCIDFAKQAQDAGKATDYVVVNCRQKLGEDAVLLSILKKFDERFPDRGFSIPEKLDILRKHLEKRKSHLIVVLDEVDTLLKKSGSDLVYTFSRFGEEIVGGRGHISLIAISQNPDALTLMDAAALSTFRRTNAVEFGPYSKEELRDIVKARVDMAFHPGTFDLELVDLVADIASEFGDARRAIEILQGAGVLADEAAAEYVTAEHIRGAKAHVHPTDVEEKTKSLDVAKKYVLLAIARKMKKKAFITTGEAEDAYAVVCEEYGEKPRAHTQFWKYLKDLDALGLIDTKISGEGVAGKTTIISLPEMPAAVLADNLEKTLKRR